MPRPPVQWTPEEVDERWGMDMAMIGREIRMLEKEERYYLRIAACAERIKQYFGKLFVYDLDVIVGMFHGTMLESDLLPLRHGLWLRSSWNNNTITLPPILEKQCLHGTSAQIRQVWRKGAMRLLHKH